MRIFILLAHGFPFVFALPLSTLGLQSITTYNESQKNHETLLPRIFSRSTDAKREENLQSRGWGTYKEGALEAHPAGGVFWNEDGGRTQVISRKLAPTY